MKLHQLSVAIALVLFTHGASAEEMSYDFVACTHSKHTLLEANSDIVALGLELWGSVASSTTKMFENATTHCAGYIRLIAGKPVGKGICKWTLVSGDTAVGEFEHPQNGEAAWTWLSGTGKLKGIAGGGTFRELSSTKPAAPGTSQGCRRDWGKLNVP